MKEVLKVKTPARAVGAAPARVRVRRKKPKTEAVILWEKIRKIVDEVGGIDELELPERFKYRTQDLPE